MEKNGKFIDENIIWFTTSQANNVMWLEQWLSVKNGKNLSNGPMVRFQSPKNNLELKMLIILLGTQEHTLIIISTQLKMAGLKE